MNFENSKTSDPYRLSLNLMDKIDLRRKDKYTALSRITNLKCQLRHEMKNLNYLMDHITYQTFKIILNTF